jgi:RNA polymerase sigma-70 factor, ECF subfamily
MRSRSYATLNSAWGNGESALEQKLFWQVFERCLDRFPDACARVFFKREVIGEETEEICRTENITTGNCWVILYRARVPGGKLVW